jgi:hypothetical protein
VADRPTKKPLVDICSGTCFDFLGRSVSKYQSATVSREIYNVFAQPRRHVHQTLSSSPFIHLFAHTFFSMCLRVRCGLATLRARRLFVQHRLKRRHVPTRGHGAFLRRRRSLTRSSPRPHGAREARERAVEYVFDPAHGRFRSNATGTSASCERAGTPSELLRRCYAPTLRCGRCNVPRVQFGVRRVGSGLKTYLRAWTRSPQAPPGG